ncbi:hypothetical protein BH09MYX1_BH09MYX1_53330 [soil metagenome]
MSTEWRVLPHEPLQKLEENLWFVVGNVDGAPLKRTMAVARRSDGRLVIHNGVALEDELMKELESHGEMAYLLVPNGFHRIDAARFKARYPKVTVLCPDGARAKVAKVVSVDGTYSDFPKDPDVDLALLDGLAGKEGMMTVRSKSGVSVCVTDAIFNMPHGKGFGGFMMKSVTKSSGGPLVSRLTRMFMIKDSAAYRAQLEKIAEIPRLKRVLVAHHEPIEGDVAATLRAIAATL